MQEDMQADKQTRGHTNQCAAGKETKMCAGRHKDVHANKELADNRHGSKKNSNAGR